MNSKNNRALLLHYVKFCASFQMHRGIQTGVTVRKFSIRVTIGYFVSRVTFLTDALAWKSKGHIFYTTPSFVHHVKAISELKLELHSRNTQLGSKSVLLSRVTLKFDKWHWKTIRHILYITSSFVHHFKAISGFKLELQSGNAPNRFKIGKDLSLVAFKFDGRPWKTTGHVSYADSSFVNYFIAISEFKP